MIQYDSRKVKPGDTFVAIPGLKHDGIDFVPQALANGAKVIVAEKTLVVPVGVEFRLVDSARRALAEMSAEFYNHPSQKLKLIGVTGTKGKTTTAFLIREILKTAGFKVGMIGTITSSLTTPESAELQCELAKMVEEGCSHCVLEVSSHALAQERVYGCHFAAAVFTNLSHDHLDYHRTMEEYLLAKQKLFAMLTNDSVAIINVDDPASTAMIGVVKGEVVPFGLRQACYEARDTRHNEWDTVVTDVVIRETEMSLKINNQEIRTPLLGWHNVYNITAAFQCGLLFGVRPSLIKKALEAVKVIPGRQEEVKLGQPFRVIIDFAHSPDSLEKILETYRPLTKGRLILVFGCPGERDRAKRPVMGEIAVRLADQVFVTTDDPHGEDPVGIIAEILKGVGGGEKVRAESDRRKAIALALRLAAKGDTVIIAGRGHEQFQDFNGEKIPFDDREIVKKILEER